MIIYNGNYYKSYRECCDSLGLSYAAIAQYRSRNKCSWTEAIDQNINKQPVQRGITYQGESFPTIAACCRALGINLRTVATYKQKHNVSTEKAIESLLQGQEQRKVFYKDKEYPSWAACCQELGVNYQSANSWRVKTHCSWDEAIKHLEDRQCQYEGIRYSTLKECCDQTGLNYNAIAEIRRTQGCSAEDAVKQFVEKRKNAREVSYDGKSYPSIKACCKEIGVSYSAVCYYVKTHKCSVSEGIEAIVNRVKKDQHTTQEHISPV